MLMSFAMAEQDLVLYRTSLTTLSSLDATTNNNDNDTGIDDTHDDDDDPASTD